MYALPRVAGEVVRLCPESGRAGAIVTVSLSDAPGAPSRARGVALYRVGVAFSWRPEMGVLTLATPGGDMCEWPFVKVSAWIVGILGGWPVTLAMEFNAGRLGLPYTGNRGERQAAYMDAVDWVAMLADAVQRRADVANLPIDSVRRVKAEGRAAVIEGAGELVGLLKAEAAAGVTV